MWMVLDSFPRVEQVLVFDPIPSGKHTFFVLLSFQSNSFFGRLKVD